MRKSSVLIAIVVLAGAPLRGQDSRIGVAMPFTVTGQALATQRLKSFDPGSSNRAAGFRATAYPTVQLGEHWYAYSAVQVSSEPFFYYESYYPEREVEAKVLQGFVGYTRTAERKALSFKVGKLASAFGAFPLRYDDTANWLLDQPMAYGSYLRIRPDQLPCGVNDFLHQTEYREEVEFYCGGAEEEHYGMLPVTLYGLPGAEVGISWGRADGRLQVTGSSPANPQSLGSDSQAIQWTAGAGYTIRQGFRVGVSAFRGPYLEAGVKSLLPAGKSARDYPATAVGADVQWAAGRFAANGEWQWSQFSYPGFPIQPAVQFAYGEVKATVTPRVYVAFRAGMQRHGQVVDHRNRVADPFQPNRQTYEFAAAYRLNRFQQLKVGYEWLDTQGVSGTRDNVLGVQFITSVASLSRAIR
jgi:hypothetical protein